MHLTNKHRYKRYLESFTFLKLKTKTLNLNIQDCNGYYSLRTVFDLHHFNKSR